MIEHDNVSTESIIGIVVNCEKLNVRYRPNTEAITICRANAGDELMIDLTKSTDDWFSVCTSMGIEGFCKKEFVEIK